MRWLALAALLGLAACGADAPPSWTGASVGVSGGSYSLGVGL